jgi:hypothetical protein
MPTGQNELLATVLYKLLRDDAGWVRIDHGRLHVDCLTPITPEEAEVVKRVRDAD